MAPSASQSVHTQAGNTPRPASGHFVRLTGGDAIPLGPTPIKGQAVGHQPAEGFPSCLGAGPAGPFLFGVGGDGPAQQIEDEPMTDKTRPYHPDDIVVWPDGRWTTLDEVRRGGWDWRSDDYEIVRLEDQTRLEELGLAADLDLPRE
jgi:hypothetical protein